MVVEKYMKTSIIMFFLGFIGILSVVPFIPTLLSLQSSELPMSVMMIQVISVAQSSVLLVLMIILGAVFSDKVGLSAPLISAMARSERVLDQLKPQILPAVIGGIAGGVVILLFSSAFLSHLPAEFISAGEELMPPWYTKLLYGGITEELLIRWGVMSFLVWLSYRITQKSGSKVRRYNYVIAIILSALIFGLAHLPVAVSLSPDVTVSLVVYIILGNAAFGFIAGYLYWKKGLECAIGAHMIAHLTMIIGETFV